MMTTTNYQVSGMTCGHCAKAVTDELTALDGVSAVEVNVDSGSVTVTHASPLEVDTVRSAIDEAGYTLVS